MILLKCEFHRFSISYYLNIAKVKTFLDLNHCCNWFFKKEKGKKIFTICFQQQVKIKTRLPLRIIYLVDILLTLFSIFLSSVKVINCSFPMLPLYILSKTKFWSTFFASQRRQPFLSLFISFQGILQQRHKMKFFCVRKTTAL